jgi:Acetyltransferase (GNAT) domain
VTPTVVPYTADAAPAWDAFCAGAVNSTFMHSRRFLEYHGDRFVDQSLVLLHENRWVGVLPAALAPNSDSTVVSHPGATYGGLIHQGWLSGNRMIQALDGIRQHYANAGLRTLIYKAVPHIYASEPAQDDLYALFRLGARRVRCDLSCTIDLASTRPVSARRRRALKKADKAVILCDDTTLLPALWRVLEQNLAREHGARPVHSLVEIQDLWRRAPDSLRLRCALVGSSVEAGVVLFNTPRSWHAQYIAASEKGYEVAALDAVFDTLIRDARNSAARYFDFGTSNTEGGRVLNDGLYRFKAEFGGGGVLHEFHELSLLGDAGTV